MRHPILNGTVFFRGGPGQDLRRAAERLFLTGGPRDFCRGSWPGVWLVLLRKNAGNCPLDRDKTACYSVFDLKRL